MKIPTIESWAINIPTDNGNYVCCRKVRPIKIFVEYVGTNMGIQVPLLVIDWRGASVMSTQCSNLSETIPVSKHNLPIYQSSCLDHFETPRHVHFVGNAFVKPSAS